MPKTMLYHLRPRNLIGTSLVPFFELQGVDPSLAAKAMAKYQGRFSIPDRPLPELMCRWGDCVLFSPVHPEAIRAAFVEAGHTWPKEGVTFLGINADHAGFSTDDTVIWLYENAGPNADLAAAKKDVVPYSADRVARFSVLPDRTRDYLREMKATDRRPLLFVGVPHVLHRGRVALDGVEELVI
ncbi:hypothetical protein ABEB22_14305 (plasmid) [Thioclava sp. 'Guangxiensis']|uniref:hypothetical protein n=1 Tax=Thioclava sp. 'Guangxiensis' TaxID=3149044 RepID=UPI0032C4729D